MRSSSGSAWPEKKTARVVVMDRSRMKSSTRDHQENSPSRNVPFPRAQEVRDYLARLLATPQFTLTRRRGQLLKYLVEHALTGDAGKVSEYGIGFDIFGKPASFDPTIESLVRTEFSRLRQRMVEYYAEDGCNDVVVIDFAPRSYAARFAFRDGPALQKPPVVLQLVPADAKATPKNRRRVAIVAMLLFVACAATSFLAWRQHEVASAIRQPIRAIVVLPFKNLSPRYEDEYTADGMTEELTNDLAQWPDLRVVARTSAFAFKDKGEDVREIGRKLNVDTILEGSLMRDGKQTRITAHLSRTSDGYQLWSHTYETTSQDLLEVRKEVANSITSVIIHVEERGAVPQSRPSSTTLEAQN